jgi:protein-tyrosine phosphatase
VELPDGARVRGRSLRKGAAAEPSPDWGLYLRGRRRAAVPWPSRRLRWPDFWLPLDIPEARSAFVEAHRRAAAGELVEVACRGGIGRTGTALACIAQLGGVSAEAATAWIRTHYHRRAVETPWQRRYVRRFSRG